MKNQKVIVIVGQTATGKSALAVKLAKKFGGEVISADSRQVYKGLDIGTAKITAKEMQGVPHYLIDVAKPKEKFTVTQFKALADAKIEEILKRGYTPIICGGTGFYIDAVVDGVIFPEVPPNTKLRNELEKKTTAQLFTMLQKLDFDRAKNIDSKNKVRLIRAIEIARHLGKVPKIRKQRAKYEFIKIGVVLPLPTLEKRIKLRTKKMLKAGLANEVKKLRKAGISEKRMQEFGFEYSNTEPKKIDIENIKYAKRQMTWFKRDKAIKWFSPADHENIEKYVKRNI